MRLSHLPAIVADLHQTLRARPEISAEADRLLGQPVGIDKKIAELHERFISKKEKIAELENSSHEAEEEIRALAEKMAHAASDLEKILEVFGPRRLGLRKADLPKVPGAQDGKSGFEEFLQRISPFEEKLREWHAGELYNEFTSELKRYVELRARENLDGEVSSPEGQVLEEELRAAEKQILVIRDLVRTVDIVSQWG